MRSKHVTVLIGLVVIATLFLSGGTAVARANPPVLTGENGDSGSVGAQVVLYDRLRLDQANGWISQNFETAFNAADNQAADDFAVPAGSFFWLVNNIEVDGFYQQPGYQAVSVNVFFYNNSGSGSLPGTSSYQGSFVPSNLNTGDFVTNLNPPAGLLAGRTYWVSVQANLDAGSSGSSHLWFWGLRGPPQDPTTGNLAAWINQGGGFVVGPCTTWGPLATCGGSDPGTTTDLQFRLSGSQINIAARVYLPVISR